MSFTTSQRWVLALTALASLMAGLDLLAVSTALTTIRVDLGASVEQLEWTVNAYNLCLAILLLPAAALGDRYGRRRLFAAGLGLFTLASAACRRSGRGLADRGARGAGAGAALVLSLALTLVSAAFSVDGRGAAIGILEGITGLALIGGPVVGGALAGGAGWEWIFWLNVPIGVVVVALVFTRIEESFGEHTGLDLRGVALAAGAALGVVWGSCAATPRAGAAPRSSRRSRPARC